MHRLLVLAALAACQAPADRPDTSRSNGLPLAGLSVAEEVAVYDAAIRAAFDVGPDLFLVTHPQLLPAGAGLDGGDAMPESLGAALQRAGLTHGSCTPQRSSAQRAPLCPVERSGYLIRATPIYRGIGDTLRMNLRSELYAASTGSGQEPFAFEMAYKLVPRSGSGWRVVAEGRVREKE